VVETKQLDKEEENLDDFSRRNEEADLLILYLYI
jgi:hypothetical protein